MFHLFRIRMEDRIREGDADLRYRPFGKTGLSVSALGFGCMRLPTTDGLPGSPNIDEAAATAMLRRAIDGGLNYIDTAYTYHGEMSEPFLSRALSRGYRERVMLATKNPVWMVKERADFRRFLEEQLRRLATDRLDVYMFHGLNRRRWEEVLRLGLLEEAERAVREGLVRHLGFSFHDRLASFRRIVDDYDGWTVALIQYNYMDVENQAGTEGLRHAARKGLAVAVMEPLLGGCLASPPPEIRGLFEDLGVRRAPADLGLQWLWGQPEVSVVLSGMSDLRQVEENLASADRAGRDPLSPAEEELIRRVRETLEARREVPCTNCGYCLPCPSGVNIPGLFDLVNYAAMYDGLRSSRLRYRRFFPGDERADRCCGCGECETRCPQSISISEWMPRVHDMLTGEEDPGSG